MSPPLPGDSNIIGIAACYEWHALAHFAPAASTKQQHAQAMLSRLSRIEAGVTR